MNSHSINCTSVTLLFPLLEFLPYFYGTEQSMLFSFVTKLFSLRYSVLASFNILTIRLPSWCQNFATHTLHGKG